MAHHGFGTFLMNEDVTITGTVTRLDFVNPHSWLHLDVTQPDGKVVAVRCEMRSATTLRRSGWSPDLFPVGKKITITGSPDRDDPYSCYVSTVIFDDGSRIDRYGQLTAPVQIGQGQRPEKLGNGQPNISGDWAQEQVVMTDPRGQIGTLVPLSQVEGSARAATSRLAARYLVPATRSRPRPRSAPRRPAGGRGRELRPPIRTVAAVQRAVAVVGRAAWCGGQPDRSRPGRVGRPSSHGPLRDVMCLQEHRRRMGRRACEPCHAARRHDHDPVRPARCPRTIHMNMTEHPKTIEPSLTGHSIGRWDGDVLAVDTVGFAPGMLNGSCHTANSCTSWNASGSIPRRGNFGASTPPAIRGSCPSPLRAAMPWTSRACRTAPSPARI